MAFGKSPVPDGLDKRIRAGKRKPRKIDDGQRSREKRVGGKIRMLVMLQTRRGKAAVQGGCVPRLPSLLCTWLVSNRRWLQLMLLCLLQSKRIKMLAIGIERNCFCTQIFLFGTTCMASESPRTFLCCLFRIFSLSSSLCVVGGKIRKWATR